MGQFTGVIGVLVLLAMAWVLSNARHRVSWRVVLGGIGLQVVLALVLLRVAWVVDVFDAVSSWVNRVIRSADDGIVFIFGENLADPSGPWGFVFAVKVLPVIIFFASFMAVLYHWGIMQRLIAGFAWVLRGTLGVTGTEAVAMAANVFVGQTEAPLCVKPFFDRMTRSQIMTIMVGGFATIAGSVLAAYVGMLGGEDDAAREDFIKHLLAASVMSAPAAFVFAKILVPETGDPVDEGVFVRTEKRETANVFDAAALGATDGLRLALNVGAMLIAFVALLALVNWPIEELGRLGWIADWRAERGIPDLSLQLILGWVFSPLAWTMGVAWEDAAVVGSMMGEKVIITEFLAYDSLGDAIREEAINERSSRIAAYALCGFANFPSIAIQIGGLTAIAPGRRRDFVELGLKAMIGGAFASWCTACIAGMFL